MGSSAERDSGTLPVTHDLRIDQVCNEYEQAWRTGRPPELDHYLDRVPGDLRQSLLRELLALDHHYHCQVNKTFPLEAYRARYPELAGWLSESFAGQNLEQNPFGPTVVAPQESAAAERGSGRQYTGQRLGDYELLSEIARGGMGVIYRARDTALDREVAVKLLQDRYPVESDVARRFVDEARITAQLQHPGIPAIHQVGRQPNGRPFLAMKLVKGRTLAELLDERSDPGADRSRFIAIFEQICHAVGYAHARRVIHRDLKPLNVMVSSFGEVQVMDWGLAKVLGESESRERRRTDGTNPLLQTTEIRSRRDPDLATEAGAVFGTPAFMSPEQAGGEVDKLGPAADVFGLGAILCVILTGQPPYRGSDSDTIRLQAIRGKLDEALAALDSCGAEPDLIALARQCLAVEPANRPADAAVVAAAVSELRGKADERARQAELERAETLVREAERRKRRRVWLSFAAAGLVVSIGLAIISMIAAGIYQKQRDELDSAQSDALARLWRAKLEEARAQSMTRGPGQRLGALKTLREALGIARKTELGEQDRFAFRNVAVGCLTLPDLVEEHMWEALPGGPGWGWYFDFDAAFHTYVHTNDHGDATVVRLADNKEIARISGKGTRPAVYLSPDGRFLATAQVHMLPLTLWRLDGAGGAEKIHVVKATAWACFRADSRAVAYLGEDQRPTIFEFDSRTVRQLPLTGRDLSYLTFSPDGTKVGVQQIVKGSWTLQIRDANTGKVLADLLQNYVNCSHAWRLDGQLLAYSDGARRIHLCETSTWKEIGYLDGHNSDGIVLAFDASGEYLLSNDWHGLLRVWQVRGGRQEVVIPAHGPKIVVGKAPGQFVVVNSKNIHKLRRMQIVPAPELQRWTAQTPAGLMRWHERLPVFSSRDNLLVHAYHALFSDLAGLGFLDGITGRILGTGNETGVVPVGFDKEGNLYTSGRLGLCRWPRGLDRENKVLGFGPPEVISTDKSPSASMSADGAVLAVAAGKGFQVVHRTGQVVEVPADLGSPFSGVSVSPAGSWIVSGEKADNPRPSRVWDSKTGRQETELRTERGGAFGFSPDGHWLWSTADVGRLWRVGTWEPGPAIGGYWMAITPDGSTVAAGEDLDLIRLVDPEKGTDFLHLRTAENEQLYPRVFSSDGARLYAWGPTTKALFVWDLRLIRKQLEELDLDWDGPAIPEPAQPTAERFRVELKYGPVRNLRKLFSRANVQKGFAEFKKALDEGAENHFQQGRKFSELRKYEEAIKEYSEALKLKSGHAEAYHYRGHAHHQLGRYREALADFAEASERTPGDAHLHDMLAQMSSALKDYAQALRSWQRSLELKPEQAAASEHLAWFYVLGPTQSRDAKKALPLAERAVRLGKEGPQVLNTLGIVYYRLDRIDEAVRTLERASQGFTDLPAISNCFVRAMCYHRLGQREKARQLFDQGVARRKLQTNLPPDRSDQFEALQAEAEKLLSGK